MLGGHSHYTHEPTQKESKEKRLDIGWDGHGKPYSWEEIESIMEDARKS